MTTRPVLPPPAFAKAAHRRRTSETINLSPTKINAILNGYKVINEVGHGAFATVYKVEHVESKGIFALKVVPKVNLVSKDDEARFQREIDSMAILKHENIVQLHNFFSDQINYYMVMDYCPNGELYDFIVKNGKIQENTAALLFQQIASAIAYCHSFGVAHRDLKPQNILIKKFPFIKVADFGLCGYVKENELMKTFCGSPAFCSPECLNKINYDGKKSDIWSLGVILYAMVTGEFPWNLTNTAVMVQQILKADYHVPNYVSQSCKDIIIKMLQLNPNDRISMEDILRDPFLNLAADAPIVKRQSLTVKPPKLPRLSANSMEQLSRANKAENDNSDEAGIRSPFSARASLVSLPDQEEQLPRLSGIMSRSMSMENCDRPTSPKTITTPTCMKNMQRRRSIQSRGSLNLTMGGKNRLCPLSDV